MQKKNGETNSLSNSFEENKRMESGNFDTNKEKDNGHTNYGRENKMKEIKEDVVPNKDRITDSMILSKPIHSKNKSPNHVQQSYFERKKSRFATFAASDKKKAEDKIGSLFMKLNNVQTIQTVKSMNEEEKKGQENDNEELIDVPLDTPKMKI
jgi:hypothetical protein